jgi:hypothetical protein
MKKISKGIKVISVALSVAAGKLFADKFEHKIGEEGLLFILVLAIIAMGIELVPSIFEFILDNTFLKKLLVGEQYIDGTWLELDSKEGKPIEVGVTRIRVSSDKIIYGGTTFPIDPNFVGSGSAYFATIIDLNWPTLKYIYEFKRFDTPSSKLHGYGELDFDYRKGSPITCRGHYISLEDGKKVSLEKWKITDKALLKKLDNPKESINAIFDFFKQAGRI